MKKTLRDHYQVLGCARTASSQDIRKAYLRKVVVAHPDRSGNKEAFQELQEAYAALYDPHKRKEYDERHEFVSSHDTFKTSNERFKENASRFETWARKMKASRPGYVYTGYAYGHSKEDTLREDPCFARATQHTPYDIDAWERGHRLGRYSAKHEVGENLHKKEEFSEHDIDSGRARTKTKTETYFARRRERMQKREEEIINGIWKNSRRGIHSQCSPQFFSCRMSGASRRDLVSRFNFFLMRKIVP